LRGVPVLLDLPADRPRPPRPSYRAGQVPVHVPAATCAALRALAQAARTTLFAVALAGFQALLLRYVPGAGQVAVGCPVNGRVRAEFEGLVGFFAKSLPVVADVSDGRDPAFAEMVAGTRDAVLAAHAHQDVPFDEIVRLAAPPRDLGHNPVFQVWFDLVAAGPAGGEGLRLPGIAVAELDTGQVHTRFDLELHLAETAGGELSGRLQFAIDLFEPDMAHGFVRHYQNLLGAVARDPSTQISEIQILGAEEQRRIIDEWGTAR
jgi:non-ribosomal peptide synthetase component F